MSLVWRTRKLFEGLGRHHMSRILFVASALMTEDRSCPQGRVADFSQPLDVHSTSLFSMNTLLTLLHQNIFCGEQSSQKNPHFTLRLSHDSKQDSRCWPGSCHRWGNAPPPALTPRWGRPLLSCRYLATGCCSLHNS